MHYIHTVIMVICFYLINLLALRWYGPNIKSSVLSVFPSSQYSAQRSNHNGNDTKLHSQKTRAELKKFEEILCLNIHTNDIVLSWIWNVGPMY